MFGVYRGKIGALPPLFCILCQPLMSCSHPTLAFVRTQERESVDAAKSLVKALDIELTRPSEIMPVGTWLTVGFRLR